MRGLQRILGVPVFAAVLMTICSSPPVVAEPRMFVVEQLRGTVRQYSLAGVDLGVFASGLDSPAWITADRDSNIYVVGNSGPGSCCQGWTGRIDKFSPTGTPLLRILTPF